MHEKVLVMINKKENRMQLFDRSFILSLILVLCTVSLTSARTLETMLSEAGEKAYSQNYQGALLVYDAVIEQNPDNIEALIGKARVLSWMGNYLSGWHQAPARTIRWSPVATIRPYLQSRF